MKCISFALLSACLSLLFAFPADAWGQTPKEERQRLKEEKKEARQQRKAERKGLIPLILGNPNRPNEIRDKAIRDSLAQQLVIEADSQAAPQRPQGPQMRLAQNTFDFGRVRQGVPVTQTFAFTNTGTEPLILQEVTVGCGCTATDWTNTPVLPDEKGSITVRFNTAGKLGPQRKHIFVSYNHPDADTDADTELEADEEDAGEEDADEENTDSATAEQGADVEGVAEAGDATKVKTARSKDMLQPGRVMLTLKGEVEGLPGPPRYPEEASGAE